METIDLHIHTPTLENFVEIIEYMFKVNNITWGGRYGSKEIHKERWNRYKQDTCIWVYNDAIYWTELRDCMNPLSMKDFYHKNKVEQAFREFV